MCILPCCFGCLISWQVHSPLFDRLQFHCAWYVQRMMLSSIPAAFRWQPCDLGTFCDHSVVVEKRVGPTEMCVVENCPRDCCREALEKSL